jgi:indole-3-glycerol phosphate synthase
MPEDFLGKIMTTKKEELSRFQMPERLIRRKKRSLKKALGHPRHALGLIAEVKQASPSKGFFRKQLDPDAIARSYEQAGADAISVLTDQTYFHGSLENLVKVVQSVSLPVLRKDFIIDDRQIEEADRAGADAILLIAAALDPNQLHEFYLAAQERHIECLVEVHRPEEADAVLSLFTPEIMGANNRNLKTFKTDLTVTEQIRKLIPDDVIFIAESGVRRADDVNYLKMCGADAALVGETLIRAHSPSDKIRDLFGGEVSDIAPST